nr:MAG TPA: hypothetical protein [Caudoviricetes sp.]
MVKFKANFLKQLCYEYIVSIYSLYVTIDVQTISYSYHPLPMIRTLALRDYLIPTLLASFNKYFSYYMLSIVVEPSSFYRGLAADCLIVNSQISIRFSSNSQGILYYLFLFIGKTMKS